ncbi:ABC transporter permease [Glycomyces terrestris]|uniref:ABC transporter permease n=1 Tax=Glycomyces terrestris TaxID=2493553 RepID=A0A426UU45_9ACTN|nr:ABC transporter permease [Glycomyces terrestris]RRR97441.1 ABC transporter permease [Glycomyces terrestris]
MTAAAAEVGDGLGTLAGTGKLLRFQARRTRVHLTAWTLGIAGGTWLITPVLADQYATPESRVALGATMNTPAMRSMTGPAEYVAAYADSIGALFANRMLLWTGAMTAVMFVLLVVRLTRADEETSRSEVLRSNPVGRRADLAAALALSAAAATVLGALMALAVLGLEDGAAGGAVLFGLAHTAIGLVFAALTAVAAQVSDSASTATGYGLGLLGWSFLTAGVGNAQENAAVWLSPLGWSQLTFMYTSEERWWPLALTLAVAVAASSLAFALVSRRDFGQGLVAARAGRPGAAAGLRSAHALTFRLTRGLMWTGAATLLLLGAAYGSVLGSADEFADSLSEAQRAMLDRGGSTMAYSFAATFIAINAVVAALFGILVIGRGRKEETVGRGELIAASPVARSAWPGSYLPAALFAATVTNLLGGLGLAATGSGGDGGLFGKVLLGTAIQLPAVWTLVAFAFAAFAWLPRAGWLRWLLWVWSLLVIYFGNMLDMPEWLQDASPFHHVAAYPAQDLEWAPLGVLALLAAALVWLGYAGARRRDLHFS